MNYIIYKKYKLNKIKLENTSLFLLIDYGKDK